MFNTGFCYGLRGQLTGFGEVLACEALVEPVSKLTDGLEELNSGTRLGEADH